MPTYPVLQPDGKIAIWSTVVNHFLGFDYTVDKATDELLTRTSSARGLVQGYTQDVAEGCIPFSWWSDWPERVGWALFQHGSSDEGVAEAMARTPDPMTRRFIEEFESTCRAESKQQDAEYKLQQAEAQLATVTVERDDYHAKLLDLEHELQLERGQVVAQQQRREAAEAQLALVERYGADQWRRGNAGQEPQEFAEWRQETAAADRRAAFNGGEI